MTTKYTNAEFRRGVQAATAHVNHVNAVRDMTRHSEDERRALANEQQAQAATAGRYSPAWRSQVVAAACIGGGLRNLHRHFHASTLNAAEHRFGPRGLSLRELIQQGVQLIDYNANPDLCIRAAFSSAAGLGAALASTATKFAEEAFMGVEDGWRGIAGIASVSDFKAATAYRLSINDEYEELSPAGEIPHGTLAVAQGASRQIKTYGKMLGLNRTDIRNDDMGALTSVSARLGRAAALKINDVFWAAYMAALGTFFTSGRGNYLEGVTAGTNDSRLNAEGLGRAWQALMRQADDQGAPLGIVPRTLLVPSGLAVTAQALLATLTAGGGTPPLALHVASYLDNTAHSAASATAWYLTAGPGVLPVAEVVTLNGQLMPTIEEAEADFNLMGVQFRAYHDFGVRMGEYRSGVRSKGAA